MGQKPNSFSPHYDNLMPNVLQNAAKVKSSLGASKEARRSLEDNNETCWTLDLVR